MILHMYSNWNKKKQVPTIESQQCSKSTIYRYTYYYYAHIYFESFSTELNSMHVLISIVHYTT